MGVKVGGFKGCPSSRKWIATASVAATSGERLPMEGGRGSR